MDIRLLIELVGVAVIVTLGMLYRRECQRSERLEHKWHLAQGDCIVMENGRFTHDRGQTWYDPDDAGGYKRVEKTPSQFPQLVSSRPVNV